METIIASTFLAVLALVATLLVVGRLARAGLQRLELRERHARDFYRTSEKLMESGHLTPSQRRHLAMLAREIANKASPRLLAIAMTKEGKNKSPSKRDAEFIDLEARHPEVYLEFLRAILAGILAVSYGSFFWGFFLREKMAEMLSDPPRIARATNKVALQENQKLSLAQPAC